MKCPKNFNQFSTQQTLAESWFKKNKNNEETKSENTVNSGNSTSKEFKQKSKTRIRTISTNSQIKGKENVSDDDIVGSSQDVTESSLRKIINKSLRKKIQKPKPALTENKSTPTPDLKFSFSDVESSVIKEELDDIYNNFDADDLTHNLSDIIANISIPADDFQHSPSIGDFVSVEIKEEVDDTQSYHSQDPLSITEKDTITHKSSRKRMNSSFSKVKAKKRKISTPSKKSLQSDEDEGVSESEIKSPETKHKTIKNNQHRIKTENILSSKETKKLSLLQVKLQHEVPPQHNIESTAGSHSLNRDQIKKFKTHGPLKKGSYTTTEDELIRHNWEMFCEIHHWDENKIEPFLSMRHGVDYYIPSLEQRKNFVKFLANGLPWRSLYSVYHRFKNLYSPSLKNGKFTSKEDKMILQYITDESKNGISNGCAELAEKLKRTRISVWHRMQKLKNHDLTENPCNENHLDKDTKNKRSLVNHKRMSNLTRNKVYKNVEWTPLLVRKFINTLVDGLSCSKLDDLKYKIIDQWMWKEMEEKTSIDHMVLQKFWYFQLHMQLFCPRPIYLSDCKINLIKHFYENKIVTMEMIVWENVCKHFNGMTPFFLSQLLEKLIQYAETKIESTNFKDLVNYLYMNHIPELEKNPVDAILPKLYYKNGKIISIDRGPQDDLMKTPNDSHKKK